jgi:hypothetical protein
MPKTEINPRELRRLAEALLDEIEEYGELPGAERADVATSLVRQWLTYEGHASLFLDEEEVHLALGRTPLGRRCVVPEPAGHGWVRQLTRDWKVRPDDLPEVLDQLNRGQSAEVVNADGVPLRLWVNPKEKRRGVEPLVREGFRPEVTRDYVRVAADALEEQLGEGLDPGEVEALARSVAQQWRRYGGHASLFLDGGRRLDLKLGEHGDGTCEVAASRTSTDIERLVSSLGPPPEVIPDLIARLNLGEEVGVQDRDGVQGLLWYDPRAKRVCARCLDPVPPVVPAVAPPALCPGCGAVLGLWRDRERQQTCSHCKLTVSLTGQPAAPTMPPPVFCPECTGVLKPWRDGERKQTCSHCGHTVSLH